MCIRDSNYKDLYDILNVSPDSKLEEIRDEYKELARVFHPDSGSNSDNEKFFEIQNAWETLSDPDKRSEYDKSRNEKGWNAVSKKNHSTLTEAELKKEKAEKAEQRASTVHGYGEAKPVGKTIEAKPRKPKRGDTGFLEKLKGLSEKK